MLCARDVLLLADVLAQVAHTRPGQHAPGAGLDKFGCAVGLLLAPICLQHRCCFGPLEPLLADPGSGDDPTAKALYYALCARLFVGHGGRISLRHEPPLGLFSGPGVQVTPQQLVEPAAENTVPPPPLLNHNGSSPAALELGTQTSMALQLRDPRRLLLGSEPVVLQPPLGLAQSAKVLRCLAGIAAPYPRLDPQGRRLLNQPDAAQPLPVGPLLRPLLVVLHDGGV
mmetsp:Transcript_40523/g.72517  ORF Transcript_40523/g.72517 Transcript_40523/m.72517 type:complete len:227 (-) Transcript_40523:402-1082(-)